jgi:hypothetical protein
MALPNFGRFQGGLPTMRLSLLGLVVVLGLSAGASDASAQVNNFSDPFFQYYSFYLPRQQAQAMQPGPEATLNAVTANRQQYAATNRTGMFDPRGSSNDPLDFADEFGSNGRRVRGVSSVVGRYGVHGGNLNGLGPHGYYNSNLNSYYRDLRTGRGKNSNVAVIKSRGRSSGFGGMGSGLPGPR